MAYTLDVNLVLGAVNTGLTLEAQLVNSAGAAVGSAVTTGFTEIGGGNYLWHYTAWPDGHRGGVIFQVSPGGALKAFCSINPEEVENADAKTSAVPTGVWAVGSRSLTTFGTLVADIWAYSSRTLTDYGSLATTIVAAVWSYGSRTLTQAIAAVTPPPVLTGDIITVSRGDTLNLPFVGLGDVSDRTELWFTVKINRNKTDAQATLQLTESDGLIRVNGETATASDGSITVDDDVAGDVTVLVDETVMVDLPVGTSYYYDVQKRTATGVRTLTSGQFIVIPDVTRAV